MDVKLILDNLIILLMIPFVFTVLIYGLLQLFRIHKWRKIHLTVQWSALLYVAGVIVIVQEMYGVFILSYVLISFLLFLAIHITVQWRNETTISLTKAIVLLLRIVFLLFFFGYLTLLTMYIIRIFA